MHPAYDARRRAQIAQEYQEREDVKFWLTIFMYAMAGSIVYSVLGMFGLLGKGGPLLGIGSSMIFQGCTAYIAYWIITARAQKKLEAELQDFLRDEAPKQTGR